MSITPTRRNMVSTLLAAFENHVKTPEEARSILTGVLYLRGDLDEVYQEIVEQMESAFGHEHGLETRTCPVVAKYLVGKHYRFCILELFELEPLKENHAYRTVTTLGNSPGDTIAYIEQ